MSLKKLSQKMDVNEIMTKDFPKEDEEYRKTMIKQKEEFDEFKNKEGDSDLIFNKKDNKEKK